MINDGLSGRLRRHDNAVMSAELRQLARVMGALKPRPGVALAKLNQAGQGPLEATRSALRARSAGPAANRRSELGQPGQ